MKKIIGAMCACLAVVSFNANSAVINTINGVDYEWLEITETLGMSRLEVEAELNDVNSALYGYEYASRQLFSDLLYSYANYDGIGGWHGDANTVAGMYDFFSDFGYRVAGVADGVTDSIETVDVGFVTVDGSIAIAGFYGGENECHSTFTVVTCHTVLHIGLDVDGNPIIAKQADGLGWDADAHQHGVVLEFSSVATGSFLVSSVVPIPSAVWLFGSGLIGLIGLARRSV